MLHITFPIFYNTRLSQPFKIHGTFRHSHRTGRSHSRTRRGFLAGAVLVGTHRPVGCGDGVPRGALAWKAKDMVRGKLKDMVRFLSKLMAFYQQMFRSSDHEMCLLGVDLGAWSKDPHQKTLQWTSPWVLVAPQWKYPDIPGPFDAVSRHAEDSKELWPLWVLVSWKLNLAHCVCNDTTVRRVLIMLYWDAALFITRTWRLSQTFAGTSNFPLVGFYGKAFYIWWILMLKPWCPADVPSKTNPLTKQKSCYTSVILPFFDGLKSVKSIEILYGCVWK